MREAMGGIRTDRRWWFLTDGGHWENLGVLELLAKECTDIIVVDASSYDVDATAGLRRAVSLARAELGVEVEVDTSHLEPGESGTRKVPWAIGTLKYASGGPGHIYYVRSVLWDGMPVDLADGGEPDGAFPVHPTSQQFYSSDLFDSYRSLGWAAMERTLSDNPLPDPAFDEGQSSESVRRPRTIAF